MAMTETARPLQEIMDERMAIVLEVARLNSERLRQTQQAGGIAIELLGCQRQLADEDSEAARRTLDAAMARDALIQTELAHCDARLRALDQRLEQLDLELAWS